MNANITKIELTETINTMGETTEEQAAEFVEHLKSELADEFPNATISVKLNNRQSDTTVYVESAVDSDGCPLETEPEAVVREFINRVWDRWC